MFLVAGGHDGSIFYSSTEILIGTSSAWAMVNNLPRKMRALRGVTLEGVIYLTGEYDIVG